MPFPTGSPTRSEEHTSELQSRRDLVCRLLLEKKKKSPYRPSRNPSKIIDLSGGSTGARDPAGLAGVMLPCDRIDHLTRHHQRALFFFNDPATPEIYTLSLHDALPILRSRRRRVPRPRRLLQTLSEVEVACHG